MTKRPIIFAALIVLATTVIIFATSRERLSSETFSYPTGFGAEAVIVTCSDSEISGSLKRNADLAHETFQEKLQLLSEAAAEAMHDAMQDGDMTAFREADETRKGLLRNLLSNIDREFGCIVELTR